LCHWLVLFSPTSLFILFSFCSFLILHNHHVFSSSLLWCLYCDIEYYLFLFLIRSCSHWILHTAWWFCVDLWWWKNKSYNILCFWYLHQMYFQIKYCSGKSEVHLLCLEIENISDIYNAHQKSLSSNIIHKKNEIIWFCFISFVVVHHLYLLTHFFFHYVFLIIFFLFFT